MPSASVRFYGPLTDFLPAPRRQATLVCAFEGSRSVKDLIESLGVPHPEVDLLVVNGRPADFAHPVREGDRIAVYPPFRAFDLGDAPRLGPPPQAEPRFVADVHLGRLAAYLRLAGLDTTYRNDWPDHALVAISAGEDRTLLTRDVGVLKHRRITRGYFLRETQPARQIVEVLRRFDLVARTVPFSRCLRCNSPLHSMPDDQVAHLLPARTRERYRTFSWCPSCARIYWQGSHYARMRAFLDTVLAVAGGRRGHRSAL